MKAKRTDDLLIHLDKRKADDIEEATGKASARDFFRGSEVGHCSNQINFKRRGTEVKEIGVNKSRFLEDGHLHQAVLSAEFKKAGVEVIGEEEEAFRTLKWRGVTFKIKAHKDGSVRVGKEVQLLEVKSVKEEKFSEILKTGDVSSYYSQIQMYMYLWNYKRCKLIVVDRNNSLRQEFTIELDKEHLRDLMTKLAKIEEDLQNNRASSRDYPRTSKECGWCPYFEKCWGIPRGSRNYGERPEKAVEVEGDKALKSWNVAIDLYHKYKRLTKEAKTYKEEADALISILLTKFKATKLYGKGGSVSRIFNIKQVPDRATIQELIVKGAIPITTVETPVLRYSVGNGEEEET